MATTGSRIRHARPLSGTRLPAAVTAGVSRVAPASGIQVATAGTTVQVTGLEPGVTYRAQVRAHDAAGNTSDWSTEITFTTASAPAPLTVAAVASVGTAAPAVPAVAAATVAATATVATPAAGYERTTSTAGLTASFTGLTPSRDYTARVRATDAAGNWSAWSAPITFTTTGAGNASPATVAATTAFPARTVGGTPPTVTAGRNRPVAAGGSVLLDVTATPPGGESIIGYNWTIQSGGGSLTNSTTATPTYTPPGSGSGLVTIRATVSATNAGQATADMTVSYGPTIIAAENALTGTARATWDLASPDLGGVSTLLGFCDGFTVDKTGTANFKIAQSDTAGWSAEVFRLGWYGGDGARSYGTLTPNGTQLTNSQAQPSPGDADAVTTKLSADASNWTTTLTWSPPAWAPSGIYILRLNRTGGGASHVMFIVRDDARQAALMFMPADSTWNAYNAWGGMGGSMYSGNSLYYGTPVDQYNSDCARFVSYNRPFVNRGAADSGRSYGAVEWSTFFTGEYPMQRFLERNGVDVKYYGCIDAGGDSAGTHLKGNGTTRGGVSVAMFVGHNEYWSDGMRAGWEAARDAGVSVFSCAGNEVFWRTVGTLPDSEGRPRLIECYKSTIASRASTGRPEWTGTWRDPDGAGKGGNRPENSFTGTIFVVNGPTLRSLVVPFAGGYSAQPLWRHTSVAALTTGQSFTSGNQILGFEWDTYGPAGADGTGTAYMAAPHPRTRYCSDATYAISGDLLTDAGDIYGSGDATHRLVVYPGGHGGLVFGTGTVNWALGVDDANTYQMGNDNTSQVIQQATLNMLTDMGAPPTTLMGGLTQPTLTKWYDDAVVSTVVATASIATPATLIGANPGTVAATAAVATPTILRTALATPAVVVAVAAVPPPTIRLSILHSPTTVAAVAAVATPTVVTASGSTATPTVVAASAAVGAPAARAGAAPAPTTVVAVTSQPAATVRLSVQPSPPVVAGTAQVGTTGVAAGATTTPAAVQATTAIGSPTVVTGNAPQPATAAAIAAIPTPTLSTGTVVSPATVAAAAAVPAAGAGSATAAQPGTVTAGTVIPQPSMPIGNAATPQTVATLAGIAAAQALTSIRLAPATVAGTSSISGTASSRATALPSTVAAWAGILGIALIGVGVTPSTVAGTATVPLAKHTVGQVVTATATAQVIGVPGPAYIVTGEAQTGSVT